MITFAYAGDSTTAGNPPTDPYMWRTYITDPALSFAGGYAHAGYTSAQVLANLTAVTADTLVIMLGTNDVRLGVASATTIANVEAIAALVGASHTILSAIAPCDITDYGTAHINRQQVGFILNRAFVDLAASHGWLFCDPYNSVRHLDNGWKSGASGDGVHPHASTSQIIADRLSGYMHLAIEGAQP